MVMRVGDPAILAEWYFTDKGALPLDVDSSFRSKNWENRDAVAGVVGEQPGPRPWKNGKKPKGGFDGQTNSQRCARYHSDWWANGLGPGDDPGPFNVSGVPTCCVDGPPASCLDSVFDLLTAEIIDIAGCGCLGIPSALGRTDPGLCEWSCTFDLCDSSTGMAVVTYVGGTSWELDITCHLGELSGTGSFSSGTSIDFTVDDDFPCCTDGIPPRSFTLRVTIP